MRVNRVRNIFIAMGLGLVASVGVMFWMGKVSIQKVRAVPERQADMNTITQVLFTCVEAENAQRGYIVTRNAAHLGPYIKARGRIDEGLDRLRKMELPEGQRIEELARAKFQELDATLKISETNREEAVTRINADLGNNVMAQLRKECVDTLIRELGLLYQDEAAALRFMRYRTVVFLSAGVLNFAFLIWCFYAVQSEMLAREKAHQANDNFLAMLSHELRTPLTPVLATLTTWEKSDEVPQHLHEDIQMLRRNVELEARLVDDLLDLTRIEKNKLPLHPEATDINALLESVVSMCRSDMFGKSVDCCPIKQGALNPFIKCDTARMHQVLWNIIKNAIKFTDGGGRVDIETKNVASDLQITIRDTGIGMSAETLKVLFRPFEQGLFNNGFRIG